MTTRATSEKKPDKTPHDQFKPELADGCGTEKQLEKGLPKAAKAEELREAIALHLKETEGQVWTLELGYAVLDIKTKAK